MNRQMQNLTLGSTPSLEEEYQKVLSERDDWMCKYADLETQMNEARHEYAGVDGCFAALDDSERENRRLRLLIGEFKARCTCAGSAAWLEQHDVSEVKQTHDSCGFGL